MFYEAMMCGTILGRKLLMRFKKLNEVFHPFAIFMWKIVTFFKRN